MMDFFFIHHYCELGSSLKAGSHRGRWHCEALEHAGEEGGGDAKGPRHEGSRRKTETLNFRLLQPFRFCPPVLEPDFHLCFCEFELSRKLCPLSDGQVLLLPELLLEAVQLLRRERGPRLPVRLVLPQCAAEGAGGRLESEV